LNEQKTFYVPEFDLVGLIVDPVLNSGWGTLYEKSKFQAFLRKQILIASSTAVAWRTLPFPCNYPSSMTQFLAAMPMMPSCVQIEITENWGWVHIHLFVVVI